MQRAAYLAQLYESVSSIPPDIQQCLLTIAQFGCDPDQVKRWYTIVRHHFGIGEPEMQSPIEQMPPPPPQRPQPNTPTRSTSTSTSSQISPASFQGSGSTLATNDSMIMTDALGIQHTMPPQQNPWMTPAVSDSGFDFGISNALSAGSSAPPTSAVYDWYPSVFDSAGMPIFTGSGLDMQQPQVLDKVIETDLPAAPLPTPPNPYDLAKSTHSMPVFVKLEASPSPIRSARSSEPAKKRSRTSLRQITPNLVPKVSEPMPRPRRPELPFRSTDPSQMPQTPQRASQQQASYVNPVELTHATPPVATLRPATAQPVLEAQITQSPEQVFYTPQQQHLPHHDYDQKAHHHQQQVPRQNIQPQQTYKYVPDPPSQEHAYNPQSCYYLGNENPLPYKSPYA